MTRLLDGRRIVVTRAVAQAAPLIDAITLHGGTPIALPLLELRDPPQGLGGLAASLAQLSEGDWLAVTSPNGAERVLRAGPRHPRCRLAVIASGTAAVFEAQGWTADHLPSVASSQGMVDSFPDPDGSRVLIAQAEDARTTLADGLRDLGWEVEVAIAYTNDIPVVDQSAVDEARSAHVVVFASPSAVDRFSERVGLIPGAAVCIGSVTAATATAAGFDVHVADEPTVQSLIHCISRIDT